MKHADYWAMKTAYVGGAFVGAMVGLVVAGIVAGYRILADDWDE